MCAQDPPAVTPDPAHILFLLFLKQIPDIFYL